MYTNKTNEQTRVNFLNELFVVTLVIIINDKRRDFVHYILIKVKIKKILQNKIKV